MRRTFAVSLSLLIAFGAMGCSGEEGLDTEQTAHKGSRLGLVHVSYEHDWLDKQNSGLLTSTAQFVRYRDIDRDLVARMLALPLNPTTDLPGVDLCQVTDLSIGPAAEAALESEEQGSVELLEAGDLEVRMERRSVTLSPRHFPGLLPFISGVIYGEAQATQVTPADRVLAAGTGGQAVGVFSAAADSPRLPNITHIDGFSPSPRLVVDGGSPLSLRWKATGGPQHVENNALYMELRYTAGKRDMALRCRPRDDGAFTINGSLLTHLSGRVTLELVRLSSTIFTAKGLDQGELQVAVKDSAEIYFR